jgi:hypothetical protein
MHIAVPTNSLLSCGRIDELEDVILDKPVAAI